MMRAQVPQRAARPSGRPHRSAPRLLGASRRFGAPRPPSARPVASLPSGNGNGAGESGLALDRDLLDRLRPWARTMARRIGARPNDIDDAVQEAFVRASSAAPSFVFPVDVPRELAVRRWILGILAHVVAEQNDRARRSPLVTAMRPDLDGHNDVDEGRAEDHGAIVEARQDLGGILRRFFETTTAERFRVWLAFEVDCVPAPEIARQEGAPVGTIYTRVRLAREDLAAMLTREEAEARFKRSRDATRGEGRR